MKYFHKFHFHRVSQIHSIFSYKCRLIWSFFDIIGMRSELLKLAKVKETHQDLELSWTVPHGPCHPCLLTLGAEAAAEASCRCQNSQAAKKSKKLSHQRVCGTPSCHSCKQSPRTASCRPQIAKKSLENSKTR